jgi:hypothetical protein
MMRGWQITLVLKHLTKFPFLVLNFSAYTSRNISPPEEAHMDRVYFRRALVAVAIAALSCLSTVTARAADDTKDNPKYQAWAKFKAGSTNTIATDIERGPNKIHVEITRTLISVSDKEVVVESVTTANVMGHDHAAPATRETIPAQIAKDQIKPVDDKEKDVEAMGKTFKCKTWEWVGDPNAKPDAHSATGTDPTKKVVVYASEDVPGGIVKMEATGKGDVPIVFVLTAMEAK